MLRLCRSWMLLHVVFGRNPAGFCVTVDRNSFFLRHMPHLLSGKDFHTTNIADFSVLQSYTLPGIVPRISDLQDRQVRMPDTLHTFPKISRTLCRCVMSFDAPPSRGDPVYARALYKCSRDHLAVCSMPFVSGIVTLHAFSAVER